MGEILKNIRKITEPCINWDFLSLKARAGSSRKEKTRCLRGRLPARSDRHRLQPGDLPQDGGEKLPGHRHLRQLKEDVSGVPDNPPTHLDELELKASQRPVLQPPGQPQPAQEVLQVADQNEGKEPHPVAHEPMAEKPRPVRGVLPLLDPLLGRTPLVVEEVTDLKWTTPLRASGEVCDNEAHARVGLPHAPLRRPLTRPGT